MAWGGRHRWWPRDLHPSPVWAGRIVMAGQTYDRTYDRGGVGLDGLTCTSLGPATVRTTRTYGASMVWWATLAVACCGAVATAHGLFAVARACGVGQGIAGLYVPITDGLALVAYAATVRLAGSARAYAWTVVVAAAGLSGLAQAVNLAGLGAPDWRLRFGVGYWPAVAVAVAAHLLWLVGRGEPSEPAAEPASRLTEPE